MSSLPGYTLQAFLLWEFNITAADEAEANTSLGYATALGNIGPRTHLTKEEFTQLIAMFEPYRETVETGLNDFDEETQSWRSYAQYVEDRIPDDLYQRGRAFLATLTPEQNVRREDTLPTDLPVLDQTAQESSTLKDIVASLPARTTPYRVTRIHYTDLWCAAENDPDAKRIFDRMAKDPGFDIVEQPVAGEHYVDLSVNFMYPHVMKPFPLPKKDNDD